MTIMELIYFAAFCVSSWFLFKKDDQLKILESENFFLEHDRDFYKNETKKLEEVLKTEKFEDTKEGDIQDAQ